MQLGFEKRKMKGNLSEYVPRKIMQEVIFNPRYRQIDKIGSGSFGEIHKVYDVIEKKLRAVKTEKKDKRGATGMLQKEAFILRQMSACHHFPRLIEDPLSGSSLHQNDSLSFIVMSFLGSNLEQLKKRFNMLSITTTLLIGVQMIEALMFMHKKGFLHRDIKPENFVIGTDGNHHNIYIIDFGLSKKYIDTQSMEHIQEDNNKGLVGTARYTSINSHKGIEQSRRDDMEALGYVLVYLAKGELPWQNLSQEKREEKFEQIKTIKMETTVEELTKGLPQSFQTYLDSVKSLEFEEEPNYHKYMEAFLKDAQAIQEEKKVPQECLHCLDWCVRGECSIQKIYADTIASQKRTAEEQAAAAAVAFLKAEEITSAETGENFNSDEANSSSDVIGRRQAKVLEKSSEKPPRLGMMSLPQFRTDSSMQISKNSVVTNGTFNGTNIAIHGVDLSRSKTQKGLDILKFTYVLDEGNAEASSQEYMQQHSRNSSEYNNVSNEYTSQQEEDAVVQKVVEFFPVHFSANQKKFEKEINQLKQ